MLSSRKVYANLFFFVQSPKVIVFSCKYKQWTFKVIIDSEEWISLKWYNSFREVKIAVSNMFFSIKEVLGMNYKNIPLLVVDRHQMNLEKLADQEVTVVENLSIECQRLYANIANIQQLDGPDFPDFSKAIELSCRICWCAQTLQRRRYFGDNINPKLSYIRVGIVEGLNNAPGDPFVLEIWPIGHYSPIHSHGKVYGLVKVLYGEITIKVFENLLLSQKQPYRTICLKQGEITWMSPSFNQTHQLHNQSLNSICVTLNCYSYPSGDEQKYPHFDYIEDENNVKQFTPCSDISFVDFKRIIKSEWEQNQQVLNEILKL